MIMLTGYWLHVGKEPKHWKFYVSPKNRILFLFLFCFVFLRLFVFCFVCLFVLFLISNNSSSTQVRNVGLDHALVIPWKSYGN